VEEAQKGAIQLVEAREDAAKVLEFVEATFDQMALAVEPGVVVARDLARWCGGITASQPLACKNAMKAAPAEPRSAITR